MKALKYLFLLSLALSCRAGTAVAQMTVSMEDTTGVIVHADPRLALLTSPPATSGSGSGSGSAAKRSKTGGRTGVIRSGRGYRVQIYNGNDRAKAVQLKMDFLRRYPNVRTYMTYIQPQYRLKVGDFKSRGEAQRMYQELGRIYSPVMIVPDIIMINTAKDD